LIGRDVVMEDLRQICIFEIVWFLIIN
jgi:hypothetical protein